MPVIAEAAANEGGRLPSERALVDLLGIPRRKLRLALDELQRRGTVFRRHGQGTFAAPPPHPDKQRHRLLAGRLSIAQLMDVRRQIEPRLAELAAFHARPEDLMQLRKLMLSTRQPLSAQDYEHADDVFHYRIAELAKNALFLEVYDLIRQMRRDAGWRSRRTEINKPHILQVLGRQHQHIYDAIAAGDVTGAGNAHRAHLDFVATAIQPL